MITEIAFVGTPVTDMLRARAFYEEVLNLKPTNEACEGQWIEYGVGAGMFAITNIEPKWKPGAQGSTVAFEVEDIGATLDGLKASGTPILMDLFETPVCRMAIVTDPDGNLLTIHQKKAPLPPRQRDGWSCSAATEKRVPLIH